MVMKKMISLLLVLLMLFSTGCQKKQGYFDCKVMEVSEQYLIVELINDYAVSVKRQSYTTAYVNRKTLSAVTVRMSAWGRNFELSIPIKS